MCVCVRVCHLFKVLLQKDSCIYYGIDYNFIRYWEHHLV